MGASCTCATECAIVWWFQCRLLKYRETDRYREIVVTRFIQLWAASVVALLAGGYTEHWITTTSLKRVEQIIKSILQGTAGNQVILSCQISLKNATCVTCLCAFFKFLYLSEHAVKSNCHFKFVLFGLPPHCCSTLHSLSQKKVIWVNFSLLCLSGPCQWVLWYVQNGIFCCCDEGCGMRELVC